MKNILIPISFLFGIVVCFVGQHIFRPTCPTFPHFPEKYKYEALMTPQKYFDRMKIKGKYPTFAPPKTLIMTVDQAFFKAVLEKYHTQQCDGCFSDVYFLIDYPSIAVAKIGISSSLAVMNFEVAIAWGIKQAIFLGNLCALQKDFALGDLMVCEKAIRDEGTSHHYLPFDTYAYPSARLQEKLLLILKEMNKPYHLGPVWTSAAFFCATAEEVKYYQKKGILGVEMEMAGLLAVASYRHVDLVCMGTRTDTLANLTWEKASDYNVAKIKAMKEFFEIALKVAA